MGEARVKVKRVNPSNLK